MTTEEYETLLRDTTIPARVIAERRGVTVSAINQARRSRKIRMPRGRPLGSRVDAVADHLGEKRDREIAEMTGMTISGVAYARRRRGVRAWLWRQG